MATPSLGSIAVSSVVAFVHAKGESERLPGKNLRVLGDRPLVCHAIRNALAAETVDAVVIDSDSDEILRVGEEAGAIPLKRPDFLATNVITGDDLAYWQAWNAKQARFIMQVVPTSPFLFSETIDKGVRELQRSGCEALVGLRREHLYLWGSNAECNSTDIEPAYRRADGGLPNSSALPPTVYETTGFYVVTPRAAIRERRRTPRDSYRPFFLSRIEAINIDTQEDWNLAEIVWKGLNAC